MRINGGYPYTEYFTALHAFHVKVWTNPVANTLWPLEYGWVPVAIQG